MTNPIGEIEFDRRDHLNLCSVKGIDNSIPFFGGEMLKKYTKAIALTNDIIKNLAQKESGKKEIERILSADIRWAESLDKKNIWTVKSGDVCQFEFGKNFQPEMSFEHRGLVIGKNSKMVYVLPICSYNKSNNQHIKAYHPIDNPKSKSNFYLLKPSEVPFIKHTSVLKLNDLRSVSAYRILYKQKEGHLDIESEIYQNIEQLVMDKYFHRYIYKFKKLEKENLELKEKNLKMEEENQNLLLKIKNITTL